LTFTATATPQAILILAVFFWLTVTIQVHGPQAQNNDFTRLTNVEPTSTVNRKFGQNPKSTVLN
jgi:hypothetical protein